MENPQAAKNPWRRRQASRGPAWRRWHPGLVPAARVARAGLAPVARVPQAGLAPAASPLTPVDGPRPGLGPIMLGLIPS